LKVARPNGTRRLIWSPASSQFLGTIDLDPASNSTSAPNVPAVRHYSVDDDGLGYDWHGRIYLNPPYGKVIRLWVEHLVRQHQNGNVTEALALLPARTDTRWFQLLRGYPMCFLRGRLRFTSGEGDRDGTAPFPSVLVYLGAGSDRFAETFHDLGLVVAEVDSSIRQARSVCA
jgi:DNA N-6-adenine-methyltransferase Dam